MRGRVARVTASTDDCVCTKEYAPVCGSDGRTYSNACTAACELGADGTWERGACGGPGDDLNPFTGCLGNVRCLRNACEDACPAAAPGSVCFQNTCSGQSLNGADVPPCAAVWVDPATREAVVCGGGDAPEEPVDGDPAPGVACASGATVQCLLDPCSLPAPSDCAAAHQAGATCLSSYCQDGALPDGTQVPPCAAVWRGADGSLATCPAAGDEPVPTEDDSEGCVCPMIYAPVCGANNQTYSNDCEAACAGVGVAQIGTCTDENIFILPGVVGEDCVCPMIYAPVCSTTNRTYGNPCRAGCANETIAYNGTCAEDGCACTAIYAPVCGADGRTYGNSCEAGCAGVAVVSEGECPAPAVIECPANHTVQCFADPCSVSSCPADPTATCVASYCSNATYRGRPVGPCEAVYLDRAGNRVNCSDVTDAPGDDGPGVVENIYDCPAGSPRVMCLSSLANACDRVTCPAHPNATCVTKICGATYRGVRLMPCSPIWVDGASGDLVECGAPAPATNQTITDINECPAGSPRVMCAAGLADACRTSSCPAHPNATCLTKVCAATYRGVSLLPCSPIWVDGASGDLVNCSSPDPRPACSSCTLDYTPVCGDDGETYPNQCAADCLGVRVRSAGRCGHCRGGDCNVGRVNDLCVLGSTRQCAAKRFACQAAAEGGWPGDFLGRCRPKPAGSSGGNGRRQHRHMLEVAP